MSVKDIPMTILDYAGIKHPGAVYGEKKVAKPTGISARAFLDGQSEEIRNGDQWYAFELFGNGYLMMGDYKLMKVRQGMFGDGQWHLYNVVTDPSESMPLEVQMPDRYETMLNLYNTYAEEHQLVEVDEEWNAFKAASDPQ